MAKEYLSTYEHTEVIGDGDKLCARFHDFEDLQVSPAGFGGTDAEALDELAHNVRAELEARAIFKDAHIAKLEAIVEKLPKCCRLNEGGELVQDCPMVPYATYFWLESTGWIEEMREVWWRTRDGMYFITYDGGYVGHLLLTSIFDTREAAQAAKEAKS